MIDVVGALADLSALRNRDQLDIDLVSLVMRLCGQQQCAIRLACVVGEEENARWLTCCRQDSREQLPVRDTVGVDLTALPLLSSVGYWQHALSTGQNQRSRDRPVCHGVALWFDRPGNRGCAGIADAAPPGP
ncbi:MAG: hypothetical protein IPG42_20975 [Betaproteobacteria bacterium]|nr:hypothetical protein [Betaproteobacteria bacterium]